MEFVLVTRHRSDSGERHNPVRSLFAPLQPQQVQPRACDCEVISWPAQYTSVMGCDSVQACLYGMRHSAAAQEPVMLHPNDADVMSALEQHRVATVVGNSVFRNPRKPFQTANLVWSCNLTLLDVDTFDVLVHTDVKSIRWTNEDQLCAFLGHALGLMIVGHVPYKRVVRGDKVFVATPMPSMRPLFRIRTDTLKGMLKAKHCEFSINVCYKQPTGGNLQRRSVLFPRDLLDEGDTLGMVKARKSVYNTKLWVLVHIDAGIMQMSDDLCTLCHSRPEEAAGRSIEEMLKFERVSTESPCDPCNPLWSPFCNVQIGECFSDTIRLSCCMMTCVCTILKLSTSSMCIMFEKLPH